MLDFGCGDINGAEIYGIINDNFEQSGIPDAVWITKKERSDTGLHPQYIIIGQGIDGGYLVLDTKQRDEHAETPVLDISPDGYTVRHVADSFGEYLLSIVK